MKLTLCIVGCGQFARTFVQGLQPLRDDIDLFFASRDVERASAYAAMFQGSGAFGSYEAAAADPRVEAMYLCTPHHLHQAHVVLSTWTEILVCFEYGSPGGIAWDGSEKMCKNICPGT